MPGDIGNISYNSYETQKSRVRQSTEKAIYSLFENNVISKAQHDRLLQMYLNGEISFGVDGLTSAEAQNFTSSTIDEIEQNLTDKKQTKNKTMYVIQPGDTPEIIAKKMGYTGIEAKSFATKIKADAIKNGMYYKYGFQTGDMITLAGDYSNKIEQLRQNGEYIENDTQLNAKYINIRKNQKIENATQNVKETNNYDINKAESLRDSADRIANSLKEAPNANNTGLNSINSNNIAFVLSLYNQKTGRNLALDLYNNGDKNLANIKVKICKPLVTRAKELNIDGIYYGDYIKIKNINDLLEWIGNVQNKVFETEEKNNPAINKFLTNKKMTINKKDVAYTKIDGQKLASELYNQIDGLSDANDTRKLLNKIKPENAAYIVTEYSNLAQNSKHRSLVKDIDEEFGFDINDIKTYICKSLVTQAKKLGLTGIYYGDYAKINDIATLENWVNNVSTKIINTQNSYNITQESSTTQKQGDVIFKTTTNAPLYKQAGITKCVQKYDDSNKLIETTYYYQDGKIVREYQDAKRGRIRELIQEGNTNNAEEAKIYEALDMKIKLPADANDNAKEFAKALEDNKEKLMKLLGIDNDTYNKLAHLAMAIAEQETDFGTNQNSTMYRKGKYYAGVVADTTLIGETSKLAHDYSYGPTQIKFEMQMRDSWIADKFEQLGLKSGIDLYDMKNAALATMVVLTQNNRIIKNNTKYQKGIEAARDNIVTIDGWEMKNGHLEKTYNTKPFINEVTDEDALCYFWNGRGVQIKDGTMEPETLEYTRNVHKYLEKYTVEDDPIQRNKAIAKNKSQKVYKNFKPMDNNGPIGSIVFMPAMYTNINTNTQDEIEILRASLAKNTKIDDHSKKLLLLSVQNGEIGFEFGLTSKEANALTQKDVDKLLSHISKIKNQITQADSSINFTDGISAEEKVKLGKNYLELIRNEEMKFKKEYLNSYSPTVLTSAIPASSVLMTPMNNDFDLALGVRRKGFQGRVKDDGVNSQNTTNASYVLATFGQKIAQEMNSGGMCMTGFRKAMLEAGVEAANSKDLQEGTPRATVGWFERHPDMFEEVKYLNIGGGKSRQINSSDLPNLPAGYIVIWIPDSKYIPEEPGHISITNGNGQAYADETDNLDWGVYHGKKNSGKGEHGVFRVFRLTNKWTVENGKLKFCE